MKKLFAQRLKNARKSKGFSLQALSDKIGVTKQAISKYEQEKSMPDSGTLIKLARALELKTDYFFRPLRVSVELSPPAYRKHSRVGKKEHERINIQVQDEVERYLELINLFGDDQFPHFDYPAPKQYEIESEDDIENAANELRNSWQLGIDPIENLVEILEDRNIIIVEIESEKKFDGLSCWANNKIPVIVIKKMEDGARQRSSIAHELGHLLLNVRDNLDEEKVCMRFSGAFLVPKKSVHLEFGTYRESVSIPELLERKRKYGMSMQQWMYRMKDLGIISDSLYKRFCIYMNKRNWRLKEPGEQIGKESPKRMEKLALDALLMELASESQIASLLKISVHELRQKYVGSFDESSVIV